MPWRLLVFSFVLLAFTTAIYFGLRFGYNSYLDTQTKNIDKQLDDLSHQVKVEDQKSFINFYSQLSNLKRVLDNHKSTLNIFPFLEKNTLSLVYYTEASFLSENGTLVIKGEADSSETLVNQMNVFDRTPELKSVSLDQMNFDPRGGSVNFGATLVFNGEFFAQPQR